MIEGVVAQARGREIEGRDKEMTGLIQAPLEAIAEHCMILLCDRAKGPQRMSA